MSGSNGGLGRVGVVGAGLVGTSIGLALARAGAEVVCLVDEDPHRSAAASALGAGVVGEWADLAGCAHVVVAVPPSATAAVVSKVLRLNLDATVSDVASVKAKVAAEVETLATEHVHRFCGGHPVAGREKAGPGAARAELFDGAAWVLTPTTSTSAAAVVAVRALAQACGARPFEVSPAAHDAVLALVSHAPQLVASALAARLEGADPVAIDLAGSGFRDTTRVAGSDPALWAEVAVANAGCLSPVLRGLAQSLVEVAAAADAGDAQAVHELVAAGARGRALLPVKAGLRTADWARVDVVLPDRPGELARLLTVVGAAGLNVEDVVLEHAPDTPAGVAELFVRAALVDQVLATVHAAGWTAHGLG